MRMRDCINGEGERASSRDGKSAFAGAPDSTHAVGAAEEPEGNDLAARFERHDRLGGDLSIFPRARREHAGDCRGRCIRQGGARPRYTSLRWRAGALRGVRRRFTTIRSSPSECSPYEHDPPRAAPRGVLLRALLRIVRFQKAPLVIANSGLPYPIRRSDGVSAPIQLPGVPLGSFPGTTYEELTFDLKAGDLYVFCTDGIYEAEDHLGHEFGTSRLMKVIDRLADRPAQAIVDGIFEAVTEFRDDGAAADD